MRYVKRPVEIKAMLYKGDNLEARKFVGNSFEVTATEVGIQTLEGFMRVKPGDYIIKGVNGEFYPCKPDIFHKTYDKIES